MPHRLSFISCIVSALLGGGLTSSGVWADPIPSFALEDEEVAESAPLSSTLTIEATAGIWLARPGGRIAFGAGALSLDLEDDFHLRSQDAAPRLELVLHHETGVRIQIEIASFEADATTVFASSTNWGTLDLAPGDTVTSDLEMLTVGFEVAYPFYTTNDEPAPVIARRTGLTLSGLGGLNYLSLTHEITVVGAGTDRFDGRWTSVYAGAMLDLRYAPDGGIWLAEAFAVEAAGIVGATLSAGGGPFWMVRAGMRVEFSRHADLFFGYRLIEADLQDGDYQFDAGLQGLFFGGAIRF